MTEAIVVSRTVSMGHRLPGYDGVCRNPHGHNMRVTVHVDPGGKFVDFKDVDAELAVVTGAMDHAMLLWDLDPLAQVLLDMGFRVVLLEEHPTTEYIAAFVMRAMARKYAVTRVVVQETDKYAAEVTR